MTDNDESSVRHLERIVHDLSLVVTELSVTVKNLAVSVAAMPDSMVSVGTFTSLRELVQRNDSDSRARDEALVKTLAEAVKGLKEDDKGLQDGISRNDKKWDRVTWLVCAAVIAGVLYATLGLKV